MTTFSLKANPTFKTNVEIHIPGQEKSGIVTFTFNHRKSSELEQPTEETIKEFVFGLIHDWAIEEPFNRDNFDMLIDNYPAALMAIVKTYQQELTGARVKNS